MDFNVQNLKFLLSGKDIGHTLHFFPETESTNTVAFKLAEAGASEGTVVIADSQRKGRGRMRNREWHSPPGVNLYTSIILRPALDAVPVMPITLMAGVAVAELLSRYCPSMITLKWPNDVLIKGRKVSGILTELKTDGKRAKFVILGIGININMKNEDMAPALRDTATSLMEERGSEASRLAVAVRLFDHVGELYRIFLQKGFHPIRNLWLDYFPMLNKCVEMAFGGEIIRGTATGIDETGALTLLDGNGELRRVIAGDLSPVFE